jgi:aminopeptidase N
MRKLLLLIICFPSIILGQATDSLWSKGLACFHKQNFHGTIAYMDSLLKIVPDFPDGYYNRGIAKISLGNTAGACADLQMAQKLGTSINKDFIEYQCDPSFVRNIMIKEFYKKEPVYPESGYRPHYTHGDTLRGALRPERTCFDVTFYDLTVRILPKKKMITGNNVIYFSIIQPSQTIQIDLFDMYEVSAITWNNTPLKWHREFNALFIDFPRILQPGEKQHIKISYAGKPVSAPNPPWDGGFVWKHDDKKNLWLGVACEYLGASSWWPTKDHLTDKPDSMQLSLEIPGGYQAVSNGDLRKTQPVDKKYTRFTWFVEYPINNYNVTFYAGKYVAFNDTLIDGKDTLRLEYNVLAENLDTAKRHFKQTREIMSFYNKAFGFYPFARDGFSLVESPYEGMEHQSAIAYGNGYGKKSEQNYRNNVYDYIIVHEAAHEWWGNSVTAEDMADIWIHEGFATFAEYMFLENRFGKDEYMYQLVNNSRYIFNVWPMVQHRNVNENSFASNDVYNKGAMLLHCLRCNMNNDSLFFSLIRDFCIQHRYQVVTSDDFINFVNKYTSTDYSAFFRKYLYDTALPVLEYSYASEGDELVIRYHWTGVDEGFKMPFGIGLNNKESIRILAGTSWQETRIPGALWFNFFNLWRGYEGAADNSFTYFDTRMYQQPE